MKFTATLPAMLLAAVLGASLPLLAGAEEARTDAKTVAPLRDVLLSQMGKRVAVRLYGDQDIEGTVTAVGADTVQLSKLAGKDFYDAVISIGKINAIIYKAR
jgi:hypothetical protein